jgi:rod shape-determining protein MreD
MKWVKQLFAALCVFLAQFLLVDFLSINMIRPDFLVIYVFYISLVYGKTTGIIISFTIGLFSDLAGVGSYFGLAPLT